MLGQVTLAAEKIGDLWVSVAYDTEGRIIANSLPVKGRATARQMVVDSLASRGIGQFHERTMALGKTLAGEVMKAGLGEGRSEKLVPVLSYEGLTDLEREIYEFVRGVPRGSVVSYGDVAAGVGRPRAARAVGNAMAKNPFPWVVPCHRVVKSDLSIGGFSGSPCRKGDLLRQEGIEADAKTGKIREKYRQARDR